MISNICKIENGTKDLAAILRESEKVAVYNELTHKQTLQLRLICEEIDGMLPKIVDNFNGDLWIELENGVCKVNIELRFEKFTIEKKDSLIGISKNKKNAAATGITGKIRSAIEDVLWDEDSARALDGPVSYYCLSDVHDHMDYSYLWSLGEYRSTVKFDEQPEEWDELEKSVIASVADDIIVGVKGKHANIVIVKKFS